MFYFALGILQSVSDSKILILLNCTKVARNYNYPIISYRSHSQINFLSLELEIFLATCKLLYKYANVIIYQRRLISTVFRQVTTQGCIEK